MFWDIYVELCEVKGSTPSAVAQSIGLSNAIPTKWKKGALPKGEILLKLAEYFNCSVDYLLTGKEKSPKSELSDLELELLEKFNKLEEVDKGRILGRMDIILDEYNRPIENAKTARAAAFGGETKKVPDLDISLNDRIDAIERQALIDEIKANQDPKGN